MGTYYFGSTMWTDLILIVVAAPIAAFLIVRHIPVPRVSKGHEEARGSLLPGTAAQLFAIVGFLLVVAYGIWGYFSLIRILTSTGEVNAALPHPDAISIALAHNLWLRGRGADWWILGQLAQKAYVRFWVTTIVLGVCGAAVAVRSLARLHAAVFTWSALVPLHLALVTTLGMRWEQVWEDDYCRYSLGFSPLRSIAVFLFACLVIAGCRAAWVYWPPLAEWHRRRRSS